MVLMSAPLVWAQYDETFPTQDGLTPVRKGSKMGYIDATGAEIVPCKYTAVGSFNSKGLAWVYDGSKYGVYKRDGQLVVPVKFKALGYFVSERSTDGVLTSPKGIENKYYDVYKDKMGTLDLHSYRYIDPVPFDSLPMGYSPYIVLSSKGTMLKDGLVDENGAEVLPLGKYDRLYMPTDGLVPVADVSKKLAAKGIKFPKKLADNERSPYAAALVMAGKGGGSTYLVNYYNPATKQPLFKKSLLSNLVSPFLNGRALIANQDVAFFVNTDGQQVGEMYAAIYPSSGQVMVARADDGKYYLVDMKGDKVSQPFGFLSPVQEAERLEAREVGGKLYGLLTAGGEWVVSPRFDIFGSVDYGFFCVKENGKWGVIDATGKEVVPCKWVSEKVFEREGQTLFWVQQTEKGLWYCYSSTKKDLAFPTGYKGVRNFDHDLRDHALVLNNEGRWGCIDSKGEIVYPFFEDNVDATKSAIRRRFADGYTKWTPLDQSRIDKRRATVEKKYSIQKSIPNDVWDY